MAKPLWIYLVGAARRIWRWSPAAQAMRKMPQICIKCGAVAPKKPKKRQGFHIDHITAIGKAPRDWQGWDVYYQRMFVGVDQLQILCQPCHKQKTKEEKARGDYK